MCAPLTVPLNSLDNEALDNGMRSTDFVAVGVRAVIRLMILAKRRDSSNEWLTIIKYDVAWLNKPVATTSSSLFR